MRSSERRADPRRIWRYSFTHENYRYELTVEVPQDARGNADDIVRACLAANPGKAFTLTRWPKRRKTGGRTSVKVLGNELLAPDAALRPFDIVFDEAYRR